jgi:lipoprotein-releasing system permease protein
MFGVYTWKELQGAQYVSYQSTRQLLLFIMALIVIVAAVNVSSATSMLALERQRDIAIIKTFGAGIKTISRIFVCGGLLTGIVGSIAGVSLGLLLGRYINEIIKALESVLAFTASIVNGDPIRILNSGYYLESIPVIIDWKSIILIWGITIVSSALASYFPARKAAKAHPVEILRKY